MKLSSLPVLPDPYDLDPSHAPYQHFDLLWGTFGATGQFEPVKTIASVLAWHSDYDEFDKLHKSPNHPTSLTPSMVRGVTYMAAGWSLNSFQRQDPLVADYIVPVQREMERGRSPLVSIPPFGRGFSRQPGLPIRCDFGPSAKGDFRAQRHRLDEPAKLSLGMVASPQSPLPFHLAEPL